MWSILQFVLVTHTTGCHGNDIVTDWDWIRCGTNWITRCKWSIKLVKLKVESPQTNQS